MSSARQQYEQGYRLARKVQGKLHKGQFIERRWPESSKIPFWRAFLSLQARKAYGDGYHWQNAGRGKIFRSSLWFRRHDITY